MNIPYYFQYDVIACLDSMKHCNCSQTNSTDQGFHPNPWWGYYLSEVANTRLSTKSQNGSNYDDESVVYWMHCLSDFQETELWNLWYILYEVSNSHLKSRKKTFKVVDYAVCWKYMKTKKVNYVFRFS